jgi:hypothetical protein
MDSGTHEGETESFRLANQLIERALKRLYERGACGVCVARILALHAASQAEDTMGRAEAIKMFEDIIITLRENDISAPPSQTH